MRPPITEPQHLLADMAIRNGHSGLLAFSALPDAPVRPVVERRPGLFRRLGPLVRAPLRTTGHRPHTRPALAADAVTCS